MRIAIIGGTGSIGLATAKVLASRGAHVTLVSRNPPERILRGAQWLAGDIVEGAALHRLLSQIAPDGVLHLASLLQFGCERDAVAAVRVNIDGTLNVLEACKKLGIRRVVFGSSIAVYGERDDTMRETDPLPANVNLYGLTKRMGEILGERYRESHGMEFVALRYSAVFGPGEARSPGMALVRQSLLRSAMGEDVTIDGASGDERAHLTHADDAGEATYRALAMQATSRCIYNVAGPAENYMTLRELHRAACEVSGGVGRISWRGRGPTAGPVDTSAFREDFGFQATISVREGLRRDMHGLATPHTRHAKAH